MRCLTVPILVALSSGVCGNVENTPNKVGPRQADPTCRAISPPPDGPVCRERGNIDPTAIGPFPIAEDQITSLTTCRDYCMTRRTDPTLEPDVGIASCVSFSWNTNTRICTLYDQSLKQLKFAPNATSNDLFFGKNCFECPRRCPQTKQINLIDNGDFELDDTLIGPWTPEFSGSTGFRIVKGHNSPNALLIPPFNNLVQFRHMCGGDEYSFSMDVRFLKQNGTDPTSPAQLNAFTGSARFKQLFSTQTAAWREIYWTFQANSFDPHIEIDSSSSFGAILDNVVVLPVRNKIQAQPGNLLKNGGFENGKLQPWKILTDTSPGVPHFRIAKPALTEGKRRFQFSQKVAPEGGGISQGGFDLQQNITTVVGARYLFSVDFLSNPTVPDGNKEALHPSYTFAAGPNQWDASELSDVPLNKVGHFSKVFTALDTKTLVSVGFHTIDQSTTVQRTGLDNIRVSRLA